MKARILSLAFVLMALFCFGDVYAQQKKANPKINTSQGDPDLSGALSADESSFDVCIEYLRLTGLGNASSVEATLSIEGTATVCCINPGQEKQTDPKCTPGQKLTATGDPVFLDVTNGNVIITSADGVCASLIGNCKNQKNFDATLEGATITKVTLRVQNTDIDLTDWYLATYNN
jgi:hypothetical protein